ERRPGDDPVARAERGAGTVHAAQARNPQGTAPGATPARRRDRIARYAAQAAQHRPDAIARDLCRARLRVVAQPPAPAIGLRRIAMNNNRTLIGIGIAALVALVAAFVIQQAREPTRADAGDTASEWLLPELHGHVNDVDRIALSGAEGKPIATIERGEEGWIVANKGGYPADVAKLRELLLKLGDAKLVEPKTANSERYAALEVGDVAAKDAKGTLVEIGGLAKPVKLIVGKADSHGGGTYVRRADDAQSW